MAYFTFQLINRHVNYLLRHMHPATRERSDSPTDDRLSATFAALANANRRAILERLAQGEATVKELAEPLQMSPPAVSRHIKVLERAGLVVQGRRAQFRPCTLDPAPLQAVADWAENNRAIWQASFDRLDSYVEQLKQPEKK